MAIVSDTIPNSELDVAQYKSSVDDAKATWISYRTTVQTHKNGWVGYTQAQKVEALREIAVGQNDLLVLLVFDRVRLERRLRRLIQQQLG